MSRQISDTFQLAYDAEVKRAYGDKRALAGTTQEKTVTDAKSTYFRKKGKGMATRHMPGSDVKGMNVKYAQVLCELQDWEAFDYVDKFDAKKINYSEVTELAEVAADCLGLRMDQIVIDAVNSGYDATKMKVGTTGAALTIDALLDGIEKMDAKGIDSRERFFMHTARQKKDLLGTTEVTSSDYNSVKALVHGEVDSFLGLKFIMIAENREEGGLPTTATDVTGFMWHKNAVGFAIGQNMETEMTWVAEKRAYLVGGDFSAGAVVVDDEGVVGVISKKGA